MLPFVVRRLLIGIPLLIASSFLVFALVANAGTPQPIEDLRLRQPPASEAQIEAMERSLGLDKPWYQRYGDWVQDLVFERTFGTDYNGNAIGPQLQRALLVTGRLVVAALIISVILGLGVGVISALRQYSFFDYSTTFTAFVFFSLPVFWLAVLLKQFVAIPVNDALESVGLGRFFGTVQHSTPGLEGNFFDHLYDTIGHLILPAITLIVISYAQYSRYTRASMLDTLKADYVRTATAKGVPRRKVIVHHALRNALIPVTTIIALDFGAVMGGAIITENVFQWQGMGTMLINNIRQLDVPTVQAWLLVTATLVIVFNIVADVIYAYLDPRIRLD
ncbi:MAG: ABC transporter permease [Acidimicrobiales bacterium]